MKCEICGQDMRPKIEILPNQHRWMYYECKHCKKRWSVD